MRVNNPLPASVYTGSLRWLVMLIYIGENHFYLASALYLKPVSNTNGEQVTADNIINNPYNNKIL